MKSPKILFLDIETSPLVSYTWGLIDQNVGLGQIKEDWFILSWAAKWAHESKVMHADQSKTKDISNDKEILLKLWELLDSADIVIGQNSTSFDIKKINARLIIHGIKPYSPFRQADTLRMSRKVAAFTSHKLEYMTDKINKKYKKLKHEKFSGFEMWKQVLSGNKSAWKEMQKYNMYDVLATEELYNCLAPWTQSINFNVYSEDLNNKCACGSAKLQKRGYNYTNTGKFQRFQCTSCGAWVSSKINILSPEKKKALRS